MRSLYNTPEDPREPKNSRASTGGSFGDGEPNGHEIDWHKLEHGRKYRCSYARYVPPSRTGGKVNTVVRTPLSFTGDIIMGTGYGGVPWSADMKIPHLPDQELIMSNKFKRNESLGPLSVWLEKDGVPVSDCIGNLGLVEGEHVQFLITFEEV